MANEFLCDTCDTMLAPDEFCYRPSGVRHSCCKGCKREYAAVYRANNRMLLRAKVSAYTKANREAVRKRQLKHWRRRHALLAAIKQCIGCRNCGATNGKLDWHHVDPGTKRFNLGNSETLSSKRIMSEMAQCVVLCASCHATETWRLRRLAS